MPNNKWFVTSIEYTLTGTGYTLTVTTDIPVHLWMRWTTIQPKEHMIPVIRRGVAFRSDKYFCFDAYEDNEQEEVGDTLEHTFIKEPWPVCQTRYFYFHGEIAGSPSPSTSTIFTKHRTLEAYGPPVWEECPQHGDSVWWIANDADWGVVQTKAPYHNGYHLMPEFSTNTSGGLYYIKRVGFAYDTSAILSNALVVAAYFRWYGRFNPWGDAPSLDHWEYMLDFPSWDLLNTAAWYAFCNSLTIRSCDIHVLAAWGDAWRDHPLTALGLSKIVRGGTTKYCGTTRHDVLNINPGAGRRGYQLRIPSGIDPPKLWVQYRPLL